MSALLTPRPLTDLNKLVQAAVDTGHRPLTARPAKGEKFPTTGISRMEISPKEHKLKMQHFAKNL